MKRTLKRLAKLSSRQNIFAFDGIEMFTMKRKAGTRVSRVNPISSSNSRKEKLFTSHFDTVISLFEQKLFTMLAMKEFIASAGAGKSVLKLWRTEN
jgi:hypothetical protein